MKYPFLYIITKSSDNRCWWTDCKAARCVISQQMVVMNTFSLWSNQNKTNKNRIRATLLQCIIGPWLVNGKTECSFWSRHGNLVSYSKSYIVLKVAKLLSRYWKCSYVDRYLLLATPQHCPYYIWLASNLFGAGSVLNLHGLLLPKRDVVILC